MYYSQKYKITDKNKIYMCNIYHIAQYYIQKNPTQTVKYFQKLIYYAYSWYLVKYNKDEDNIINFLFKDDKPKAWPHGPVFENLFYVMTYNLNFFDELKPYDFDDETKKFLDAIFISYGKRSSNELEKMSKVDFPWKYAHTLQEKSLISDKIIFKYYSDLLNE